MNVLEEITKTGRILYRQEDDIPKTIIEAIKDAGYEISSNEEALEMYKLYDFTDKVQLLVQSNQFPSLLNYVKTGLLTEEEMLQAMLGK